MSDVTEPAKLDAARLIGYIPAITIIALFILAVFNIGYFSRIGLHFLGVMDFSNLVYSFSFVVMIVAGSLGASLWGDYLETLVKYSSTFEGRKRILWAVGAFLFTIVAILAVIHFYFPQIEPKHFLSDRLVALVSCAAAIILLAVEYADFKKYHRVGISGGGLTLILSILALYYLGRAVAEHQIYTVKTTYEFEVKDRYLPIIGKILRSSSVGFVIFTDDRILFLPQGEIKRVTATEELGEF
jgi:hypothetical protein